MVRVPPREDDELESVARGLAAIVQNVWRAIARSVLKTFSAQKNKGFVDATSTDKIQPEWDEGVQGPIFGYIKDVYRDSTERVSDYLDRPVNHEDVNELLDAYLHDVRNRLRNIGDEVWSVVKNQVTKGVTDGDSIPEIALAIMEHTGVSEPRSMVIARTEVHAAHEAGSYAQAQSAGMQGTKEWMATNDSRTRETHRIADGQKVPLNQPFQVGEAFLRYPGDVLSPAADETINCRCSVAYDFDVESTNMGTDLTAAPGDSPDACESDQHLMPDGSCMDDEKMYSGARWDGVLTVEGIESGDGRMFAPGALTWDKLPIPLRWQKESAHGGQHDVTVAVGNIDEIWRQPDPNGNEDVNYIMGAGSLDLENPDGREVFERMKRGYMRGNSVDVDSVSDADVRYVYPNDTKPSEDPFGQPELMIYTGGRIRASTLVEIPAFTEARLSLAGDMAASVDEFLINQVFTAVSGHKTATTEDSWDSGLNTKRLPSPMPLETARKYFAWIDETQAEDGKIPKGAGKLPHHMVSADGTPGAANLRACSAVIAALNGARGGVDIPAGDRQAVYNHVAAHLRDAGREPPEANFSIHEDGELVAAVTTIEISDAPPKEWFNEPTDVTPGGALTVTSQGRVYGYVAPAKVRHRSFRDRSQYVPMKKVDYSRFMGGQTITADGGRVSTGNITMNCGHATTKLNLSSEQASEHYDNTCSIVASVRVGENRDGVWIAGALLPDVTGDQVQRMMSCRLSGDWRSHLDKPGWREFVAALLVPVPGFPMARQSPTASTSNGQLVASSVPVEYVVTDDKEEGTKETPEDSTQEATKESTQEVAADGESEPLGAENVVQARAAAITSVRERLAAENKNFNAARVESLRSKVQNYKTQAERDMERGKM